MLTKKEIKDYKEAGRIAVSVTNFARKLVKPETPLLEIAEKIEDRIYQLGGKPAFPVGISCNEIAAHYSPLWNDTSKVYGIVKIDFGVCVDGYIVDTAFSIDLSDDERYKKIINVNEKALLESIKLIHYGIEIREIGRKIQEIITSLGFSPIRNLSGHQIKRYKLHAGITIPNYDNNNSIKLEEGVYAVEPFVTSGIGIVQEGKPSGIYELRNKKPVRDLLARKILEFIIHEYKTLPFTARWIVKKFGTRALISLNFLEKIDCIYQFPYLVEKSKNIVSQAEDTILVLKDKVVSLTRNSG